MALSYVSTRTGAPKGTVTTTANAIPELTGRPDCIGWTLTADPANTANIYVRFSDGVPTSADEPLVPGAARTAGTHGEKTATIRMLSASGTQTYYIHPDYTRL